jgi:integrase
MAERLTSLAVARLKEPGWHPDGRGLYLQIKPEPSGAKSWIFRYERDGRERAMGLGPTHIVGLAAARDLARAARALLHSGVDPMDARDAERAANKAAAAREMTFDEAVAAYLKAHEAGWKNIKHGQQWRNTLKTYASPFVGRLRVRAIDTPHVMQVLEPIWTTKTETATRVRSRIESVLDWATTRGYREGLNPARWKGHMDTLLPEASKVAKKEHHAALPYAEVAEFVESLRSQPGLAPRALEFAILTAARTSEVLNARWTEFDLDAALWIVPAERMKMGKEHRVPLSARAVEILRALPEVEDAAGYVWPGAKVGQALSNMSMLAVLKRMERQDLTVHGFRSTFRDWAAEATTHPRDAAEMALAHAVGNAVEAAYRRGDMFKKRRALMDDWAAVCCGGEQ